MNDEKESEKIASGIVNNAKDHKGGFDREVKYLERQLISDIASALLSHGKSCYERGVSETQGNEKTMAFWMNKTRQAEAKLKEAEEALSGRTVSCSNCNEMAKRLSQAEAEIVEAKDELVLHLDDLEENLEGLNLLQLIAKALNGIFWRDKEIVELKHSLSHLMDVAGKVKKALNLYPQFSEKYVDVKYSENCFREMVAKALDCIAEWDGIKEGGK